MALDKTIKKETKSLDKIAGKEPTPKPKPKTENKIIIKGSIILNVILVAAIIYLAALFGQSQGCCSAPIEPDTTNYIGKIDRPFKPPRLPKESATIKPAVDTAWYVDTLLLPLPNIRVQIVDYRDQSLKVAAVMPEGDSFFVRSYTWFTPSGFQLRVLADSIQVDTFPSPQTPIEIKPDVWNWVVKVGSRYAVYDTTLGFTVSPYLSAGGELGPLRLGQTYLTLTVLQLEWAGRFKGRNAALVASSGLEVKF